VVGLLGQLGEVHKQEREVLTLIFSGLLFFCSSFVPFTYCTERKLMKGAYVISQALNFSFFFKFVLENSAV
jgi:hypothetical protein